MTDPISPITVSNVLDNVLVLFMLYTLLNILYIVINQQLPEALQCPFFNVHHVKGYCLDFGFSFVLVPIDGFS